jgi:hypothetical protein
MLSQPQLCNSFGVPLAAGAALRQELSCPKQSQDAQCKFLHHHPGMIRQPEGDRHSYVPPASYSALRGWLAPKYLVNVFANWHWNIQLF